MREAPSADAGTDPIPPFDRLTLSYDEVSIICGYTSSRAFAFDNCISLRVHYDVAGGPLKKRGQKSDVAPHSPLPIFPLAKSRQEKSKITMTISIPQ
jgi:hypothetical protein